jgi:hypothetical protein
MSNPVAKTFYSHRVFLVYRPEDYRGYLTDLVDKRDWPKADAERFPLELGLLAWGTILVYRARMVPFDFNRELKRLVDENGQFLEQNPALPLSRSIYRLQLAMQLGIEAIARRPDVRERIADVPLFWQYLYDTLYWPSVLHEQGLHQGLDDEQKPTPFVVTRNTLREYLWFRARGDQNERPPDNFAPADILAVLFKALEKYLELLANPVSIRNETIDYARQPGRELRRQWIALAEAIDTGKLIEV